MRCPVCHRRLENSTAPACVVHGSVELPSSHGVSVPENVPVPSLAGYSGLQPLGKGGFARVYRAQNLLGNTVALKVASADNVLARDALVHEAKLLQAVGPPVVPSVFEIRSDSGCTFMAFEFLPGTTLAEVLAQRAERFSMAEVRESGIAILSALQALHQAGYVHADLKPENIFLDGNRARLIDLGTARKLGAPGGVEPELIVGTPEYLSPEEIHGKELTVASDIYSVGVLLYEMFTGRPPFVGSDREVRKAHLGRRPPRPSLYAWLSKPFESVILRCLDKEASARFPSCGELMTALEALNPEQPVIVTPQQGGVGQEGGREKQTVALLFFVSDEESTALSEVLASFGGETVHSSFDGQVAAFTAQATTHPARRALVAGQALIERGLVDRVVLDIAAVSVKTQGSTRRITSPLFTRVELYPTEEDPPGLLLREVVMTSLGFPQTAPVATRPDCVLFQPAWIEETSSVRSDLPIVGREVELDQLMVHAWKALTERSATLLTVLADAGFGKSHLGAVAVHQLETKCHEAQVPLRILHLRATEPAGSISEPTFRQLLMMAFELPRDRPPDAGRGLLTQQLGLDVGMSAWPGIALAMGWVSAEAPEIRTLASAPGVLSARASRALGIRLRMLADVSPLLLVLDDAQWADDATLEAVEMASLAESSVPLCVLTLARPLFETRKPEWGMRAAQNVTVRLEALEDKRAEALCRHLLLPAEHVPALAVQKLVERTAGIPLLLVELIRALKGEGMVREVPGTDTWYVATDAVERAPPIPLVEWLADRELQALPEGLAAHARLCAILGKSTETEIRDVLDDLEAWGDGGPFPMSADVATARLVSKGVLLRDAEGRVDFRHAVVREAVAKGVSPQLSEPIHRAAYRYYGDTRFRSDSDLLAKFAFHASKSGQRREALDAYLKLGSRWRNRHVYVSAEWMYSRALDHVDPSEILERMKAHRGRGLMRFRVGRFADANSDFMAALDCARTLQRHDDALDILLDAATALDWELAFERSGQLTEEACGLAAQHPVPQLEAKLLLARGRKAVREIRYREALELLEQAAVRAQQQGDEGYETLVVSELMRGGILSTMADATRAKACFDRILPLIVEKGDSSHLGSALLSRTFLWTTLGEKSGVLEDGQRALRIARETGNSAFEALCLQCLSESLMHFDDLDLSEDYARQAVAIEHRRRKAEARSSCDLLLARILALRPEGKEGVRQVLQGLKTRPQRARSPEDEAFEQALALFTGESTLDDWEKVVRHAYHILTQADLLDVFELHARSALERNEVSIAIAAYEEALGMVNVHPNPIAARLRLGLAKAKSMQRVQDLVQVPVRPKKNSDWSTATQQVRKAGTPVPLVVARIDAEHPFETPVIQDLVLMGRDPRCEVCIDSKSVSRFHAAVYRFGRSYRLRDLQSKNGTFLNGEAIDTVDLREGDVIHVAGYAYRAASKLGDLNPYPSSACVLFLDIANYTRLAEKLGEDFVARVGRLLNKMYSLTLVHRGCPLKNLGDGLLSVFGIWDVPGNTALAALKFAKACRELARTDSENADKLIEIRIGIALGPIQVSDSGALDVFGDTVNLASRLEQLNKSYRTDLLLNDAFVHALQAPGARELDTVTVRGRVQPVTVHTLRLEEALTAAGESTMTLPAEGTQTEALYREGLKLYREGEFSRALNAFSQAAAMGDRPAEMMCERLQGLKMPEVKQKWTGVWHFDDPPKA